MLKILLRSRMEALLSVLTGAGRTKKAQSKGKLVGFAVYQANLPEHFSGNVTGIMLILIFAPLVRYFIRLARAR